MRVHLKGVHTVRKRLANGGLVTYHYAWRGGPRLNGEPGSAEFLAAYNTAYSSHKTSASGTLDQLICEFRKSAEFGRLANSTQGDYRRYLAIIEEEFGDLPIAVLEDPRIRGDFMQWRDSLASNPRKADFAWSVLARVLSVARNRGRIKINPCERGGRIYRVDRTSALWNPELIALAYSRLPEHLRWAFVLALWTGQRQGDLLRLSWSSYDGSEIHIHQSKTGKHLSIPVGEPLRLELSLIPKKSPVILTNSEGKPWTSDGFRASWRSAVKALGISGVTFHDLRGSAVTRLAEAGATHAEIVAITGHSHRDAGDMMDKHYLSPTKELARSGIRRLEFKSKQERKL